MVLNGGQNFRAGSRRSRTQEGGNRHSMFVLLYWPKREILSKCYTPTMFRDVESPWNIPHGCSPNSCTVCPEDVTSKDIPISGLDLKRMQPFMLRVSIPFYVCGNVHRSNVLLDIIKKLKLSSYQQLFCVCSSLRSMLHVLSADTLKRRWRSRHSLV